MEDPKDGCAISLWWQTQPIAPQIPPGMGLHHLPGQPRPVPDRTLRDKILPKERSCGYLEKNPPEGLLKGFQCHHKFLPGALWAGECGWASWRMKIKSGPLMFPLRGGFQRKATCSSKKSPKDPRKTRRKRPEPEESCRGDGDPTCKTPLAEKALLLYRRRCPPNCFWGRETTALDPSPSCKRCNGSSFSSSV